MNKKKIGLCIISCVLAVLLAAELIWLGTGLGRHDLPEPPKTETAEIYPEMVDASEQKDQPDEDGEEKEDEDEEEEPPEEPEPPQNQIISQKILEAETVDDVVNEKPSDKDSDKKTDGDGETGDGEEKKESGEGDKKEEKPEEKPHPDDGDKKEKELKIITNLGEFKNVDYDSLQDDTLAFYARLENAKEGMTLKVQYAPPNKAKRDADAAGTGGNYTAKLGKCETYGQVNTFYLDVMQNGKSVLSKKYTVRYRPKQADEDNPTTGKGVTIEVQAYTLRAWNETSNQNPTLVVRATSNESGKTLFANDLKIYVDGQLQTNQPTGGPWYEYQLYLDRGHSGDYAEHKVEIQAVDGENTENSAYTWLGLKFHTIEDGEIIGTAYIQVDASTVGWGPIDDPWPVDIRQGQPASYAVLEALEKNGIDVEYSGDKDVGFYIRGLNLGDCSGLEPDALLWQLIDKDGLTKTGVYPGAVLREHCYTQGSGWMYSVGGSVYSGKGLSGYYLSPGETLYLRYTVAYGKDIGGSSSAGGVLTSYCTSWINGAVLENHVAGTEEIEKEATCTEEGRKTSKCKMCGKEMGAQPIPALGHDYVETGRTEATTEAAGQIVYQCSHCGDTKTEEIPILPPVDPTPPPEQPVDPDPTPPSVEGGDPET